MDQLEQCRLHVRELTRDLRSLVAHLEDGKPVMAYLVTGPMAKTILELDKALNAPSVKEP